MFLARYSVICRLVSIIWSNYLVQNIIWFNAPFSSSVKTNIGKLFLTLLQKHFPRHHKYYKLFNKNNVKTSYSCMSNMKSVIQNHNANLLLKHTTPVVACSCSCRQKSECSLNKKSLSESLVYKATVSQTPSQINKYYYGTCEKTFKERYNNHTATFRNKSKQKSTGLSKHIWELKGNNIQHQISWDIASRARPYNGCTRKCDLCLIEKLTIGKADPTSLLNTRDEFISKCRHKNKFTLKCFKISQ